ncbi:hypothetical protein GCM10025867_39960 [Frondihabitans sucicola]|uniref:M23ase beta-sheet core domain-containing protein n=1 Tax=Frondihabitans sucicola TaxID=1268041 RepID=A0ABM8GTH7_9MICO|nr:M23 family metallopeptidase [Frondihabitans sucicola]BDZ51755.1 hypothetical protein GCM10025867_39960 [Frondihabitans sucicola]
MTTLHPAADSEGDAVRASDDPTAEAARSSAASVPLTRREARALERAEAGQREVAAAALQVDSSFVVNPVATEPLLGPARLPGRRDLRAAERAGRRASAAASSVRPAKPTSSAPRRASAGTLRRSSAPGVTGRPSGTPAGAAEKRRATAGSPAAPRRTVVQRTTRFGVLGAMLFVGATIVSTSVPANAYYVDTPEHVAVKLAAAAESGTTVGGAVDTRGQKFVASRAASAEDLDRDGYSVTSKTQAIKNTSSGTFSNDPTSAVQWPFAVGVPISSGFGARQVANCGFCSTFHEGLDFIPGAGSPIQIVADGTVSKVDQGSGALGYNVWIEHTIGGKKVTSVYAHMLAGSIKVTQGQQVKVGQIVGLVGSTGNSTGAHLHFEIHIDGVPVDPYPWLEANAGS